MPTDSSAPRFQVREPRKVHATSPCRSPSSAFQLQSGKPHNANSNTRRRSQNTSFGNCISRKRTWADVFCIGVQAWGLDLQRWLSIRVGPHRLKPRSSSDSVAKVGGRSASLEDPKFSPLEGNAGSEPDCNTDLHTCDGRILLTRIQAANQVGRGSHYPTLGRRCR